MSDLKSKAFALSNSFKIKLTEKKFQVKGPIQGNYCYELKILDNSDKLSLQFYFGKKGLKRVLQGNYESKLYSEIKNILDGEMLFTQMEQLNDEPEEYIGIDESGKGDAYGPLVISAVGVNSQTQKELKNIGVKDSKLFSDDAIKKISPEILQIVDDNFFTKTILPEEYNNIYSLYKNLNKLLAWGHAATLKELLKKFDVNTAISDKFSNKPYLDDEIKKQNIEINLHQYINAERYVAVAAASILARNEVIKWFDNISEKTGILFLKGGLNGVEKTKNEFIEKYGSIRLHKVAKLNFKNFATK